MPSITQIAQIAAQLGHPSRTAMLVILMDGRALTAGELAAAAGITPATASGHLSQLVDAGLLAIERQGRHRYHRLASPAIATMMEEMMSVAAGSDAIVPKRPHTGPREAAMRHARTCYDHLGGWLAVNITNAMTSASYLVLASDGATLTDQGAAFLQELGVTPPATGGQRPICRTCLDWSERRPHLGGWLGKALLGHFRTHHWLRAQPGTRALTITPPGLTAFQRHFGINGTSR